MSDPNHSGAGDCNDPAKQPVRSSSAKRNAISASSWEAPVGVAAGTWDYVNRNHIGDQYDAFVKDDPLSKVDRQVISRYLPRFEPKHQTLAARPSGGAPRVIDFGAGTGRTLLPLVRDGYRGLAVDLSESMLKNLREKMLSEFGPSSPVVTIQANLVDLQAIADHSADHGVCMLSTLGMIQGAPNRAAFLNHVRRIIRPSGLFFVHAHNYFYQWRHPGGLKWAAQNAWDATRGKAEIGDRMATYRQVSGMFIHQFRRAELRRALNRAGFSTIDWYGVDAGSETPVAINRWHHPFRFVGWIGVASSTAKA